MSFYDEIRLFILFIVLVNHSFLLFKLTFGNVLGLFATSLDILMRDSRRDKLIL